jgi:uncharacterized protein
VAIFVDTGAWYAASVPSDPDHATADSFLRSNAQWLVTTDYIYDELLTLFRSRGHLQRAKDWIDQTRQHRWEVIRNTDTDIEKATEIFFAFTDKNWSFTDCTSWAVIQRLNIRQAFAFDDHFRQFGNVAVVP